MNKDFQNIDRNIFSDFNLELPKWLKVGTGLMGLIILLTIKKVFFARSSPTLPNPNKKKQIEVSPRPTKKIVDNLSPERKIYQEIKTQLEDLDPTQKDLLPPEIDLEVEFKQ